MELIDTHCHLDDPRFDADREAVVDRARAAGVSRFVVPATTAALWPRVRAVCAADPDLFPAYGLHPMFEPEHRDADLESLDHWLADEPAVAVGECGLDYFVDGANRERQRALFRRQVELAVAHDLPLVIHARRAVEEAIQLLKAYPGARGVFHSFSGSLQQALLLHERGFLMSFGGPVTYEGATRLRKLVARLPAEAIMLESDAPDQPDAAHRGGRNEPACVAAVLQTLGALRGEAPEAIAATTCANARRLFRLD